MLTLFCFIFSAAESNGQTTLSQNERPSDAPTYDPDDPPETTIRLAPGLTFGGQVELEYTFERNLDLDGVEDEDLSTFTPELSLAFSFDPSDDFQLFFDLKLAWEVLYEGRDKKDGHVDLQFEQAYLLLKNRLNERVSLQIGRQRFDDEREWLFDEEIDAARLFLRLTQLSVALSAGRVGLFDRDMLHDDEPRPVNHYIAEATYEMTEEIKMAAYVLLREDRSERESRPLFFGIHSDGELTDHLDYWLELAAVGGREGSNQRRGFGWDLGSTYVFDRPPAPSITLGYAFGRGDDDPGDGVDESFRQTGLENNEASFNGVPDFKYYGEIFDPELSNLSILTAGVGIKPAEENSVDLVYHIYLQDRPSDRLRNAGITAAPDGRNRNVGSEIDLIIGHEREEDPFELLFVLGYFIPGKAFPSESEKSFLTRLTMQFEF